MGIYQEVRPTTLDGIVGNEDLVDSLKGLALNKERPQTYLFTGPSGTGKTTLARILAREFGANEMSIREVNSSNNRGIDTAREIISELEYVPSEGILVYIIDEVHKTTNEWQNAMLKVLEEPPEYVYFMLCTTEPSKLIAAVKNRCIELKTSLLGSAEMISLLRKINRDKKLGVMPALLEDIDAKSQGSPRLAINILEYLSSSSTPEGQEKLLAKWVGGGDESPQTIELCRAVLNCANWRELAPLVKECQEDVEKIRHAVLGYMSSVLLGGKRIERAAIALKYFAEPFYNTGKAGLILACLNTLKYSE